MSDEKLGLEDVSYLRSLGDKAANGQYAIGRQWFYDFARRLEITLDELGDTRELKAALKGLLECEIYCQCGGGTEPDSHADNCPVERAEKLLG